MLKLAMAMVLSLSLAAQGAHSSGDSRLNSMRSKLEKQSGKKIPDAEWNRFSAIMKKRQAGEELSAEEKKFFQEKKQAWMDRKGREKVEESRKSTGMIPLTQLGKGKYKGEEGGLYGQGHNKPDAKLQAAADKALAEVKPRDAKGMPARDGKVVLISVGMSNTTREFSVFKATADKDKKKSPHLVIVDCAQGGQDGEAWVNSIGEKGETPWSIADERLKEAGVTPAQVQVVWIKHALARVAQYGEFPKHAQKLQEDIAATIKELKARYPNLQVAYLSSRIYAGYANTGLNPEPYSYEGAFAVRWTIQKQSGDAPVALWGPYLWADGVKGRKADKLVWNREDLGEDGTHPSEMGQKKVTEQLLKFFKTDRNAKGWFAGR